MAAAPKNAAAKRPSLTTTRPAPPVGELEDPLAVLLGIPLMLLMPLVLDDAPDCACPSGVD